MDQSADWTDPVITTTGFFIYIGTCLILHSWLPLIFLFLDSGR
jgi:hypothetical protein